MLYSSNPGVETIDQSFMNEVYKMVENLESDQEEAIEELEKANFINESLKLEIETIKIELKKSEINNKFDENLKLVKNIGCILNDNF